MPFPPNRLRISFAVSLLILTLAALVVMRLAARHTIPRKAVAHLRANTGFDTLFLGNSVVEVGVKEAVFAEAAPGSAPLNLGVGGSGAVEFLALLKASLKAGANNGRPKTVVCGFFDLYLSEPPIPGDMAGNKTLDYYVEPETTIRYRTTDAFSRLQFRLAQWIPMVADRYWVWATVEKYKRRVGDFGLRQVAKTNAMGRVDDFAQLEAASRREFADKCRTALDQAKTAPDHSVLNAPMQEFLAVCRENNARLFIVSMPTPATHRRKFYAAPEWSQYTTALRAELAGRGVAYVDAAEWVPDKTPDGKPGFQDAVHLADRGADLFTRRIAAEVRK